MWHPLFLVVAQVMTENCNVKVLTFCGAEVLRLLGGGMNAHRKPAVIDQMSMPTCVFWVLAIFLVMTARSSNAKALPSSAQFLRHRAAVHTARLGSNTICHVCRLVFDLTRMLEDVVHHQHVDRDVFDTTDLTLISLRP